MIVDDLRKAVKKNIRDYGMYIALIVIMGIFTILTKGIFISSRNISNLLNQTGYIAVLAVGMTLVIVIRHIDLSVGFLSGFLGAIAAIAMVSWHMPVWATILLVLALGVLGGLITALPVAQLGVPAFVASLAGWLIYRGAQVMVTASTGTIIIPNASFNAIGNGYIPDIFPKDSFLPGVHKLTLILGALTILWFVFSELRSRKNKLAYKFESTVSGNARDQTGPDLCRDRAHHMGARRVQRPFVDGRHRPRRRRDIRFRDEKDGVGQAYLRGGRKSRSGRTLRHKREKDHLPGVRIDGAPFGAFRNSVRVPTPIGDTDGRHALRDGRDRGRLHRRGLGGGRCGKGDGFDDRRPRVYVSHERL